ncbi:phospholipase D-like domain-containing protein [Actinacidiphila glaucinigra]|uniref:phospholipase D-like domain-containing protein n=1 Tax=Actinacidiphila glaucinigra TaxID=235986 RepID=UPI0036A91AA6
MTEAPVEDIVRRLSKRPGYRLVTYREVGLPFWDVPVRCRLLARKSLGVLDEFTLRCVEAGLNVSDDVSRFLNLPTEVTDAVMGRLVVKGHIIAVPANRDTATVHYVISDSGRQATKQLAEVTPEERTLRLAFDGLTRKYTHIERSLRWRPRDLRAHDIQEIPAFPVDPPAVGPDDTSEVSLILRDVTETAKHDLITVMSLDGKREKFFLRAIALIFESADKPDEVQVQFAIDGRLSEDHALAFAKSEGRRKIGLTGPLRDVESTIDSLLGEELLKLRADEAEVAAIRRTAENYKNQLSTVEERVSDATDERKEPLVELATEMAGRLDAAEEALRSIPVRVLEVHEHRPLLLEALKSARERLMIISPWIRTAVVNESFVADLERLLKSGVSVAIGFGIDGNAAAGGSDQAAERRLADLSSAHNNFQFVRLGDTHAKVLVVDHSYAVVTSFNWLSFRGDPNRPFRDERGTMITIAAEVDRLYSDYLARMESIAQG